MAHTLAIGHREGRLGHREIVYGIEDIGLARTIIAHKTVDALGERDIGLREILEIYE